MNFESFEKSLKASDPPVGLNIYLLSLWHDAKGDWSKAHDLIQDEENKTAGWVHAYLHRKEGDIWNADYWYRKAGKPRPDISLNEEWKQIAISLLKES
jgi:hypothetical protein